MLRIGLAAATAKASTNVAVPAPPQRTYYYGGETGQAFSGWSDANGPLVGGVHANEYVVPSFVRHRPAVINATRVIEGERQAAMGKGALRQAQGNNVGENTNIGGGGASNAEVMQMGVMILQAIHAQGNKPVVFFQHEKDLFDQEYTKIKFAAQG